MKVIELVTNLPGGDTVIKYPKQIRSVKDLLNSQLKPWSGWICLAAEVTYYRRGNPKDVILYEQRGSSAEAVINTFCNAVPKNGWRIIKIEVKVTKSYTNVIT